MPASPHQIAVLTPRKPVKIVSAAAENVAPPALAISDLPIAICVLD